MIETKYLKENSTGSVKSIQTNTWPPAFMAQHTEVSRDEWLSYMISSSTVPPQDLTPLKEARDRVWSAFQSLAVGVTRDDVNLMFGLSD